MKDMDWGSLGFGYIKTDYNVRCYYRDGQWGELEVTDSEYINMHMAATCLHYGQEAFEGLKAFRGRDGRIRLFRAEDNARRMIASGDYLRMAQPPVELFIEAVKKAVEANERFVPPYGTGASLYIRPLLIGTGAQVGVKPASEYLFMVFVTPVGPYYKEGFRPIRAIVDRDHDRAAPHGTGHIKAVGNYGASLISGEWAHAQGFPSVLYLDAKEKKYIDECGAANFFAIRDGAYITPQSPSVLPSINNMSLMQIAADLGLKVERRPVAFSELATFEEAGSCGTAAVISPVGQIFDPASDRTYTFGDPAKAGPWCTKLYDALRAIQLGEAPDTHNWVTVL
ncbi:MAG: branched-chain amino acid aminotransferase [Rikenellaceae bacterium]|jgi:branched-chain amino acid aminotransferase|nr:branched-chain amino acid aminotransferase [Rikenellaceae bacterium]